MRLKAKYLLLLTWLLLLLLVLKQTRLKVKYLLLLLLLKKPNVSNLVKKTDYNTKINEIEKKITDHNHDKHITTPEFNEFMAEICDLRLKQANLASKSDIANLNC